jgi:hypothetical protein
LNGQKESLRTALATGMKLIKQMAVTIASAKSEVSVIQALETAIKRLDMDGDAKRGGNGKENESGYEKFRSWAALWKGSVIDQGERTLATAQIPSQDFPDTSSLWEKASFGRSAVVDTPSSGSVREENQLKVFDPGAIGGTFSTPDDQWQVDFGALNGFDTGMEFGE